MALRSSTDASIVHAELYCDQLALQDGESVLDLGCGWGSFTLYAVRPTRCVLFCKHVTSSLTFLSQAA